MTGPFLPSFTEGTPGKILLEGLWVKSHTKVHELKFMRMFPHDHCGRANEGVFE